jgi:hypothetical protein
MTITGPNAHNYEGGLSDLLGWPTSRGNRRNEPTSYPAPAPTVDNDLPTTNIDPTLPYAGPVMENPVEIAGTGEYSGASGEGGEEEGSLYV